MFKPKTITDSESLWTLWRQMTRIRKIEEAIAERYSSQKMRCPVHLSIGQEGVAAGVAAALIPEDQVMSGHRSHAHYLAKGGNLPAMLAEIHGRVTGCCKGRGGSMHLIDQAAGFVGAVPIVASTIPISVGLAFADRRKNKKRVTVAFFGEAATEEGVFAESLNFAALHSLPIVFVCENNLYSVYSPMSVRQPRERSRIGIAAVHGIGVAECDGNNAQAVQSLMSEVVNYVRGGSGPAFLEFSTYRWREHCGPGFDNHIGYRTEDEAAEWLKRDPILRIEEQMEANGFGDQMRRSTIIKNINDEIASAFEHALNSPFPKTKDLMDYVYA